jgi:hypothetical protein
MEVKTKKGRVKPAQQALVIAGMSVIVRSVDEAMKIAEATAIRIAEIEGE